MLNIIKREILKFAVHFIKSEWKLKTKIRILIQINNNFDIFSWEKTFSNSILDYISRFEIIYTDKKCEFLKLIRTTDICFCFGLSSFLDLANTQLKLLYVGLSGKEFLENRYIPPNLIVENCSGISSEAIAEYVLSNVMVMNRNIQITIFNQVKRRWIQSVVIEKNFIPINKKNIGILGLGKNGKAIANIFHKIGCYVIGLDIEPSQLSFVDEWFVFDDLSILLNKVDVVVIALPLTNQTKNLFNIKKLSSMKPDSLLVNISRGEIIHEKDLVYSLQNEIIGGAILDVFEKEPLSKSNLLWRFNNVIITPHISGNINLFKNEIQKDFINKLVHFLKKKKDV